MKIDMKAYRERHPQLAAQMDQKTAAAPKVTRLRTKVDLTLFSAEELTWSEHEHQVRLVDWSRGEAPQHVRHQTAQLFALPNGGYRSIRTGVMLKAEGVVAGTPDLMLPVVTPRHAGLWIELKRKGGRPSPEQLVRLAQLDTNGYHTAVCTGWQAARNEILAYLGAPL